MILLLTVVLGFLVRPESAVQTTINTDTIKIEFIMTKKIKETHKLIENGVVAGYKLIEKGVVTGYRKIEDGVVSGYKGIEDKFVDQILRREDETVEEAKTRLGTTGKDEDK